MIKSWSGFLQCLRRAGSLQAMRPCIYNYKALDWYHAQLYVDDVPTWQQHCVDPLIHTISFSGPQQAVACTPGLVAILDGCARANGREFFLNDILILEKDIYLDSMHPYSTVLHMSALDDRHQWLSQPPVSPVPTHCKP